MKLLNKTLYSSHRGGGGPGDGISGKKIWPSEAPSEFYIKQKYINVFYIVDRDTVLVQYAIDTKRKQEFDENL